LLSSRVLLSHMALSPHHPLRSFPTRRSSDIVRRAVERDYGKIHLLEITVLRLSRHPPERRRDSRAAERTEDSTTLIPHEDRLSSLERHRSSVPPPARARAQSSGRRIVTQTPAHRFEIFPLFTDSPTYNWVRLGRRNG